MEGIEAHLNPCSKGGRKDEEKPTWGNPTWIWACRWKGQIKQWSKQCPGRFLGVISQNSSVPNPTGYMLWSFGFSLPIWDTFHRFRWNGQ